MCAIGQRTTGLPFAAADLCALPIQSASLTGIVCFYAVIHLDRTARRAAYLEFARVLRPGGYALIAFHTSDADTATGAARATAEFFDQPVELTFHFLDPAAETDELTTAGLVQIARLDRAPDPELEHASLRSYLLVRRGSDG